MNFPCALNLFTLPSILSVPWRGLKMAMTKRERMVAALEMADVDCVPSCFSLHFPKDRSSGKEGVEAHLDFFRASGVDAAKIMNENLVPSPGKGTAFPDGYKLVKGFSRKSYFINRQIEFTKEILGSLDGEYFTLGTLHGICASALHPIEQSGYGYEEARRIQTECIRTNPRVTEDAFKRIADGMCSLARGYKEAGVDAVYYAALGAEGRYLTDEEFERFFKPYDLQIMEAIKGEGMHCILHICKDGLEMSRYKDGYSMFCDAVNWGVHEVPFSLEDGRKLFSGKAVMGGMANRSGVLVDGTDEEIRREVDSIISSYGKRGFILGADCTLSTGQDMHRLSVAIGEAKEFSLRSF